MGVKRAKDERIGQENLLTCVLMCKPIRKHHLRMVHVMHTHVYPFGQQPLLEPLIVTLQSEHRLSAHAAGGSITALSGLVGASILEGRLRSGGEEVAQDWLAIVRGSPYVKL